MKTFLSFKKICQLSSWIMVIGQLQAQVDPALQQENISGSNNVSKLRTVLDWAGLVNSSNILTAGAITNNGQIITTASTGFQYQINYFKEAAYMALPATTSAFKYDYSGHASYGTGKPKQAALNYGPVCSSLQVSQTGTYRMEATNIAGGAVPLQFSIVDLDQNEQIQIEGYNGATYVAATLKLRSSLPGAPIVLNNGTNMQVRAGFATNKNDFLETSMVDVFFLTPVDKVVVRQTFNSSGNGYTLFTNFKAISSVDVVKLAGMVTAPSIGTPTVFEVPYTIKVANLESLGLNLNNIQISENLNNPFPVPGATSVTIKGGSFSVMAPAGSGISINSLFNGTTNYALLNGTGTLKANESATINFIVIITYPNQVSVPLTARNNQVHASGLPFNSAGNGGGSYTGSNWTSPPNSVSIDSSTNAATPPSVANSDTPDPTPVFFGVILAVRWMEFSAMRLYNSVILSWTVIETGNDFYSVERSSNGMNWKSIAIINSSSNSTIPKKYVHADNNALSGIGYYRLKQTNNNGSFSYSAIILIKSASNSTGISVYPNPVNQQASVQFQHTSPGKKSGSLYNLSGALLHTYSWNIQSAHETVSLQGLNELPKATYVLIIKDETDKIIATRRINKQ